MRFSGRRCATAISEFRRLYPGVDIVLQLTDKTLDLTASALDIGIHCGAPPEQRILARKLAPNRRFLCAAPAYLAPWEGAPSDIYAIYLQRHYLSSKVRVFLDFWAAKFADQRALEAAKAPTW